MIEGIINKLLGGFYYVMTDNGVLECRARGLFRKQDIKPLVGDRVGVQIDSLDETKGYIIEVRDRDTRLDRPAVANVNQSVIVFSIKNPKPNIHLLDKMLFLCEVSGIDPLIVFNKCDLDEDGTLFDELKDIYKSTGYRVIETSTKQNIGIDQLRKALEDRITVFAGPSGVGKSTLLNVIIPGLKLNTGEVSKKIQRGKHTTRHTELILVPGGGFVLDTPGFTSLDLAEIEPEDIKAYMPEFVKYQEDCRFQNCNHMNEPSCAVIDALNREEIHFSRYNSYKLLFNQAGEDKRRKSW